MQEFRRGKWGIKDFVELGIFPLMFCYPNTAVIAVPHPLSHPQNEKYLCLV